MLFIIHWGAINYDYLSFNAGAFIAASFRPTAPELDTILFGASYGDGLVVSGTGSLVYENVRVDSLGTKAQEYNKTMLSKLTPDTQAVFFNDERVDVRFTFDTVKVWCNERSVRKKPSNELYNQDWEWAYNGEKLELLRLDGLGKRNLIVPFGSIRAKNDMPLSKYDPRYYGLSIMGESVSGFLKGSLGTDTVSDIQYMGEENLDNITCNIVKSVLKSTGKTITVWLVPEYMYRPKRIEIQSPDERTEINTTFKYYGNDIWFPALIQKEIFYHDPVTGKEIKYSKEIVTVTEDFALNSDISNQVFEIKFPIGLNVYDSRTGDSIEIK